MRKFITVLALASVLLFLPVATANAVDPVTSISDACATLTAEQKAANPACADPTTTKDPVVGKDGIINRVANLVAWFAGAVAVIMIIFAGFRMVKSSGDPQKITQARETIIYALVGLVVIALSRFIIGLVISNL